MKDELDEIMTKFVGLRAKLYSYSIDDSSEEKKQQTQKVCYKKVKFEIYKNWLGATQHDNKTNYLEKNEINRDIPIKGHKQFIKNNKLILKTLERF